MNKLVLGVLSASLMGVPLAAIAHHSAARFDLSIRDNMVTGIVKERVFQQGSLVKAGDVLLRIEPNLFKVRVASARASLQKAQPGSS